MHWKTKKKNKDALKRELIKLINEWAIRQKFKVAYQDDWHTNRKERQRLKEWRETYEN